MRRDKDKGHDRLYGWGLFIWIIGCAGISETITSGRGNIMVGAVIFSVGLAMILWSYKK